MEVQKVNAGAQNIIDLAGTGGLSTLSSLQKKSTGSQSASISPLAEFAYSHDIQELSYNKQETQFAYRKGDNSIALRAHSFTDIQLKQETFSFDLTFSAEALGLTAKDFAANGGKPMSFSLSYQKTELDIQYESVTQVVNTLRKPEDILLDFSKALQEVLKNPGNKSVSFILDGEARQSLMTDPKIIKLFGELVMIIAAINVQKEAGPSSDFTINVSGKGKPYLNQEEKTTVSGQSSTFNFNITIQPPQADKSLEGGPSQPSTELPQGSADIQV